MTVAKSPSGFSKIGALLGSLRFWTITCSAAAWAIGHPERIAEAISGWLAAVAAVGTTDTFAKLSAKTTTTTITAPAAKRK